jgi:hypothetical protein
VRRIAWRAATVIFLLIALGIAVSAGRTIEAAIIAVLAVLSLVLLILANRGVEKYGSGD